jgi:hypothetical protein
VAEEAARGGVDAVGAAAEIDAVEVELEDLVLAEAPLDRERQDSLADLAAEGAAVGQEDVAGELLGDGRAALSPAALGDADLEGAGHAERVDADMRAVPLVLDRDHRVLHDLGYLVVAQPFAEAGSHRNQHRAVGGAHTDRLAEIVAADQLLVARQRAHRDRDRDDQCDQPDQAGIDGDLESGDGIALPARAFGSGGRVSGHGWVRDKACRVALQARVFCVLCARAPSPYFRPLKSNAALLTQ